MRFFMSFLILIITLSYTSQASAIDTCFNKLSVQLKVPVGSSVKLMPTKNAKGVQVLVSRSYYPQKGDGIQHTYTMTLPLAPGVTAVIAASGSGVHLVKKNQATKAVSRLADLSRHASYFKLDARTVALTSVTKAKYIVVFMEYRGKWSVAKERIARNALGYNLVGENPVVQFGLGTFHGMDPRPTAIAESAIALWRISHRLKVTINKKATLKSATPCVERFLVTRYSVNEPAMELPIVPNSSRTSLNDLGIAPAGDWAK